VIRKSSKYLLLQQRSWRFSFIRLQLKQSVWHKLITWEETNVDTTEILLTINHTFSHNAYCNLQFWTFCIGNDLPSWLCLPSSENKYFSWVLQYFTSLNKHLLFLSSSVCHYFYHASFYTFVCTLVTLSSFFSQENTRYKIQLCYTNWYFSFWFADTLYMLNGYILNANIIYLEKRKTYLRTNDW